MDFETFVESLFQFIKNSDNMYFVVYAVATCIATQVLKKLFVNKINSDVLHKVDFAVILPFVVGIGFAVLDVLVINKVECDTWQKVWNIAVSGATTGALASVMFRFVSSLSGESLKSLMKDNYFEAFYNQLLYFGNIREQLLNKKLSFKDFISEVKLVAENAKTIYADTEIDSAEKYEKLCDLLKGIVSDECVVSCAGVISKALEKLSEE